MRRSVQEVPSVIVGAEPGAALGGSRRAAPSPPLGGRHAARRRVRTLAAALAGIVCCGAGALAAQEPTPDPVRQTLAAALQALDLEDWVAAERSFARVTELDPGHAPAWLGLTEARLRLERPQEALEAARRAEKIAPELGAAPFAVARSLVELGSHREALAAAERALELDPESTDALVLTSLLRRELGRAEDARALLEPAWRAGVRDPRVAEQLAVLRLEADDAAGAAEAAAAGLEHEDAGPNLHLVLAFALARDPARREEAVPHFERALEAGVAQPGRVRLELGSILLDSGRFADALPHLEEAARLLPDASAVAYRLAQARRAAGDEAGAQQSLQRFQELASHEEAVDRESKELGIALNEAQSLANADRLNEALGRLDDLHAAHPDDPRVNALRAKVLFSLGRRVEAEQSIRRAGARRPDRAEYQYLEGLFHMYAGRHAEAEAALRRALAIDDGLAEAHALIAGALVKQRRPEEALTHFRRAIELGADAPEVRLGYASALETLGRDAEAAEQMEAYRRLGTSGP